MNPSLFLQLRHNRVNPRETRHSLGPLGKCLGVFIPGYFDADVIPFHPVKVGISCRRHVEELAPKQLTI